MCDELKDKVSLAQHGKHIQALRKGAQALPKGRRHGKAMPTRFMAFVAALTQLRSEELPATQMRDNAEGAIAPKPFTREHMMNCIMNGG